MNINGVWVGWGKGDNSLKDMTVKNAKAFMRKMFASYCRDLADTNLFDQQMYDAVVEMQRRLELGGRLKAGTYLVGILDLNTQYAMGFKKKPLPWFITVEGHQSNMWFGPVADTATQLAAEGLCYFQPTGGWDTTAIPFNNKSGVLALAENIRKAPANVDIHLGGFSQGMIIVYDYLEQYGIPKNLKSGLWYGNPCRKAGSVAQWQLDNGEVTDPSTHGLDPLKRFALNGKVDLDAAGIPYRDVWRQGDIFTDNTDDQTGDIKAAVYQMVARGLGTILQANPWSMSTQIANVFGKPVEMVWAIMMSIIGGIKFLADPNNPHYSPYNIDDGKDWMRENLKRSLAA